MERQSRFSVSLKKAIEKRKGDAEDYVKGTMMGVLSRTVKGTPVGDPDLWASPPPPGYVGGTLRGAWQISMNAPDYTRHGTIDQDGSETITKGLQVLTTFKMGQDIYLTNPQPYAVPVEYGHSTQTPPGGMLRLAIAGIK